MRSQETTLARMHTHPHAQAYTHTLTPSYSHTQARTHTHTHTYTLSDTYPPLCNCTHISEEQQAGEGGKLEV